MKADSESSGIAAPPSHPREGLAHTPAIEFRTSSEACWLAGTVEDNPAALIINPAATRESLDAAVRVRAESLAVLLGILESADQAGVDLGQMDALTPLAALASELRILVDATQAARGRHA